MMETETWWLLQKSNTAGVHPQTLSSQSALLCFAEKLETVMMMVVKKGFLFYFNKSLDDFKENRIEIVKTYTLLLNECLPRFWELSSRCSFHLFLKVLKEFVVRHGRLRPILDQVLDEEKSFLAVISENEKWRKTSGMKRRTLFTPTT